MFSVAVVFLDEMLNSINEDKPFNISKIEGVFATLSQVTDKIICLGELDSYKKILPSLNVFGAKVIHSNLNLLRELSFLDSGSRVLVLSTNEFIPNLKALKNFLALTSEFEEDILYLSGNCCKENTKEPYMITLSNNKFCEIMYSLPFDDMMSTNFISTIDNKMNKKNIELCHESFISLIDNITQNEIERMIRLSICLKWQKLGIVFEDMQTVYIDSSVKLMPGVIIGPMTVIKGNTFIGSKSKITAFSWLEDTVIGENNVVWSSTIVDCNISDDVIVGPYAYLRGNCQIEKNASIGAHCELNDTKFGEKSKCRHFSYLGHAHVGNEVNIGAGTITCNYDGINKHHTIICEKAFIGSSTMLIAPVTIGSGAITGAGSVVTRDVSDDEVVCGVPAKSLKKTT